MMMLTRNRSCRKALLKALCLLMTALLFLGAVLPMRTAAQTTGPVSALIEVDSQSRFYRSLLSQEDQQTYDILLNALVTLDGSARRIKANSMDQISCVMEAVLSDYCEIFWLKDILAWDFLDNGTRMYHMIPHFRYTEAEIREGLAFLQETTAPIIASLDNAGEYEKALGVYRYLTDRFTYVPEAVGTSLSETLQTNDAVCEGYARTAQYLFRQLDMNVLFVDGTIRGRTGDWHAWNLVQVDGTYYHFDATWGDQDSEAPNYDYFLVSSAAIGKTHVPLCRQLPQCPDTAPLPQLSAAA